MSSVVPVPTQNEKEVLFHPELLQKFDINGPRYTSYPSADRFHSEFGEADYLGALQRVAKVSEPLSLYFHLPFCPNICYYCGCNKIITKDHGRSAKYIKYLAKEMAMICAAMGAQSKIPVTQLHWGGGTPTFLSHEEMIELMHHTREHFDLLPDGEYSIEIDPRRVTEADIALLAELGFNRISLGVQDFNLEVQQAVHRVQTIEETQAVMDWSRKYGFKSRSVDLIYGLPKQTPKTFKETVDTVLKMSPDRLSVYNYAHLPHIFKPQRRIAEADLPGAADELAIAQREGKLHRNFQGYSTQAECDLLAFGISSIGKVDDSYSQNVRTLDEYYATIDDGHLPTLRGLRLDKDDLLRRELIGELMCQFALDTEEFAKSHQIDFKSYFKTEIEELKHLEEAGLLEWQGATMVVPIKGRLLARRVAMTFDRHLRESQAKGTYSKVL
jgi:oxygen-independent coproporphyrinogen III oxidase